MVHGGSPEFEKEKVVAVVLPLAAPLDDRGSTLATLAMPATEQRAFNFRGAMRDNRFLRP
jgi:hypothetical protein